MVRARPVPVGPGHTSSREGGEAQAQKAEGALGREGALRRRGQALGGRNLLILFLVSPGSEDRTSPRIITW